MDKGGREPDIARELKITSFVAGKLASQSQRFTQKILEGIYRNLLEMDESAKTSQVEGDLALDMLVVSLTS